jgi:peptide/nickel transport system ATP-binding protein
VTFGEGPEPAIQTVQGRDVACHLHGVTVREDGRHVGNPLP